MDLVRDAISVLWTFLAALSWCLKPFQWQYVNQPLYPRILTTIVSSHARDDGGQCQTSDPRVARMNLILRTLGPKMSVKVLPRRSSTSVAVDLAIASTLY